MEPVRSFFKDAANVYESSSGYSPVFWTGAFAGGVYPSCSRQVACQVGAFAAGVFLSIESIFLVNSHDHFTILYLGTALDFLTGYVGGVIGAMLAPPMAGVVMKTSFFVGDLCEMQGYRLANITISTLGIGATYLSLFALLHIFSKESSNMRLGEKFGNLVFVRVLTGVSSAIISLPAIAAIRYFSVQNLP